MTNPDNEKKQAAPTATKKKPVKKKPVKKKGLEGMRRSSVRNGFSSISLMIMIPVFFLTALFLLVFPRSTVSNIEKRNLASFPEFSFESYFSGAFTAGVAEYYDDTVPYRDNFKNMGYDFKSLFGIHTDDEVKIIGKPLAVVNDGGDKDASAETKNNDKNKNKNKDENSAASAEDKKTDKDGTEENSEVNEEASEQEPFDGEFTVENGIIVVKHDGHYRALELFGGGTGNTYVKTLNKIHKDLGDSVRMYSMIAPLASEFYTPASYSEYTASQKECLDSIASRLDDGIVSVDADSALAKHTGEDIYLRTDHHWTPLGAYYAAQAFADASGVDFRPLDTFEENKIENFIGTMYAFTGDANIKNDPEDFIYYKPACVDKTKAYYYDTAFNYTGSGNFFNGIGDPSAAYLVFMGGDEQIVKVKTNTKNGKRLLVVKDSYGNAVPGYLFDSFEEIYVVDMRYFDLNLVDFAKQNNITDMLFAMVVYSAVGDNADNLENLRTQNKGQKIIDEALADE